MKKPVYKKWWFWVIAVFVFFVIIGSLGSSTEETKVVETLPSESYQSEDLTTIDKLWIAVDRGIGSREGVDVEFLVGDPENTIAYLIQQPETFWDGSDTIQTAYSTFVKFGREALLVEEVDSVGVELHGEFTDQYGNSDTSPAVRIIMPRSEFEKYDWDNLEFRPISQQIRDSARIYFVHPAVQRDSKPDKLFWHE